ncbi:hypothetical protein [Nitrosomonas sp. Nm33]|uniref:hypothetical protein n=1 Tax=Nitrosomonas sp. Nm33 TaxID=133724 RepID=UPI000898F58E|nr:hypothetical protein [Nitrosomonas sp. Nm33]SDX95900.1 hypothetical protein SAMN05421755_100347 [Nitrosomonas sp. Nm33]
MAQFNLDFQLSRIECVVLQVQGKQRRGMVVPFQRVATQPSACKIAQSVPEQKHPQGKDETYRKGYYIYNINTRTSNQLKYPGLI